MFRQKIAEVTNCSCRLISNDKNQFGVFKTQNINPKIYNKQQKQKFSLKNQTNSSTKHDNKVTSAQKTVIKHLKLNQDQKISISGNIDSKKKKPHDKNTISSPYQRQIEKIGETLLNSKADEFQNPDILKKGALVKTSEANRVKTLNKGAHFSNNQNILQHPTQNKIKVSNFTNSNNPSFSSTKSPNTIKTLDSFQDYYKFISNPYNEQKNKQNLRNQNNKHPPLKKNGNNIKNEPILIVNPNKFNNNLLNSRSNQIQQQMSSRVVLQQINYNMKPQIIHGSLQKFNDQQRPKQMRATYNGAFKTKNLSNQQNIQQTEKKIKNHQIYQKQYTKIQPLHDSKSNYCLKTTTHLDNKNDFHTRNMNFEISETQQRNDPNLLKQSNFYLLKQNKSQVLLNKKLFKQENQFIKEKKQNNLFNENIIGSIQAQSVLDKNYDNNYLIDQQRKFRTTQNSQIRPLQQHKFFQECSIDQKIQHSEVFNKKNQKSKLFIERMNTFNDIMSTKEQCQSVLGEGQNQNQQSVVIMRYKDLFSTQHQNESDQYKSTFLSQHQNPPNTDRNYILKQLNIDHNTQNKNKIVCTESNKESKFLTNIKQYGKKDFFNDSTERNTLFSNNMKKTVKVTKQYLTHNFNV